MCHFGNFIGQKILFRFSPKFEQKVNVKFEVNNRILKIARQNESILSEMHKKRQKTNKKAA